MKAIRNRILLQDMEEIAGNRELADVFKDKTVFITGGTGLLGSQISFALACMNELHGSNIHITVLARSMEKAQKVFGGLLDDENFEICFGDVNQPISYGARCDYVIHAASATSSRYFVSHPVETILTALEGTKNVLEFGRNKGVMGFLYLSSLEVYGTPPKDLQWIKECDYGYIDPLNIRSSYSEGKRMAECMCVSYAKEYHVPVKVARLSQTFGPGVAYNDGRMFAEFARCAIEQKDIVLHTRGNTVRSYCYTKDAVSAILYILLFGPAGEAYNVSNMDTAMSVKDIAEMVCGLYPETGIRVRHELAEDISAFGYNPEMVIRLDSQKLSGLGWRATVGLKDMFQRMIDAMKEDKA